MKKNTFIAISFIVLGIAFLTTTCSENDKDTNNSAAILVTAQDHVQAAAVLDDLMNQLHGYVALIQRGKLQDVKALLADESGKGPVVYISNPDENTFPKTIIIDFGTQGYEVIRGNRLTGKMTAVVSNKLSLPNSYFTLAFDNFALNGIRIAGNNTLTYKGLTAGYRPYWLLDMQVTITRPDGLSVTLNSTLRREIVNMNGTPLNYWDDTSIISGSASGINANGKSYSMEINPGNPLVLDGGWPYFTKGSATITFESQTALIDYGDGTKDNKATVTVNGVTREISLRLGQTGI